MSDSPRINVHRSQSAEDQYDVSSFVTKLEAHLRFCDYPYGYASVNLNKAPRHKMPYIQYLDDDGKPEGAYVGETAFIIHDLVEKDEIPDLNADLSPAQKGQDAAIRCMVEDRLNQPMAYERWIENYYVWRDNGPLKAAPWPIRVPVGLMVSRDVASTMHGTGFSRFTSEERDWIRHRDLDALNGILDGVRPPKKTRLDEPFWVLGGSEPTEADASVYGLLAPIVMADFGPMFNPKYFADVKNYPLIRDYVKRIHNKYFSDYKTNSD